MIPAPSPARRPARGRRRRTAVAIAAWGAAAGMAAAQGAAPAPPPPASAGPAAPAAPVQLERVEVQGRRASETDERRRSTAARTVYGREDIERHGDATLGEVLRRLPGVTLQGAPGRGGGVRLRGLGSYTQILLDGERVPPGFPLDTLAPDQVERIEIYRAPTAETGARAIAGTINIVSRGGFRRRLNELRPSLALESGRLSPGLSWTRNDSAGAWTWNVSVSAFHRERKNESETVTVRRRLDDPSAVALARRETFESLDRRSGLHLTSRLQWRGEDGESLVLSPFLIHSRGRSLGTSRLQQTAGADPARYDHAASDDSSEYTHGRLNGQWSRRLGADGRLETRFVLGASHIPDEDLRSEFDAAGGLLRSTAARTTTRDRTASGTLKYTTPIAADHEFVSGIEAEATRRRESHAVLENGRPVRADLAGDFGASTGRLAAYAQDEWTLTPQWSAHAGLRWEGIATRADDAAGGEHRNASSVWTPLLHLAWKPAPQSRDRVRLSLTRSYRSPSLAQLVGRPVLSARFPAGGPNEATAPDRAGNPDLRPELATGLDLAVERYLPAGGVLSASVFHRRISDVIRQSVMLEPVPGLGVERWVARPRNVGDAVTQGVELEAKFRLDALAAAAPPVDLRGNLAYYRSRVFDVPGPDNRLDQQPRMSASLGADWRLRRVPLTLGGNLAWNPAYDTRLSTTQTAFQGRKRVVDLSALWTFDPTLALRLSANNVAPLDHVTAVAVDTPTERETARTTARTYTSVQLRLEMKL